MALDTNTTFSDTNSPGRRVSGSQDLASYNSLNNYMPRPGDYIIWSGWWSTWHGIVSRFDPTDEIVSVIFANLPAILFRMGSKEQTKETFHLDLDKIRTPTFLTSFAVHQYDKQRNSSIWYV